MSKKKNTKARKKAMAKKKAKARKKPMAKASITDADVIWHYTTGFAFEQIVEDGFIKPATAGIDPGERPAVHFSAEPMWEPTANKMVRQHGFFRGASKQETYERGGGLVRFGVRRSRTVPWAKFKKKSRMSVATARGLEVAGREQGAVPRKWYAVFGIVPEAEWKVIEVWDHGAWVRVYPKTEQEADNLVVDKEMDDAHHG